MPHNVYWTKFSEEPTSAFSSWLQLRFSHSSCTVVIGFCRLIFGDQLLSKIVVQFFDFSVTCLVANFLGN